MSVELAITTGFIGGAFLLVTLANNRASNNSDTENAPDFLRLFYLLGSFLFVLGTLFSSYKFALNNGYPGLATIIEGANVFGLIVFLILVALVFYDFFKKVFGDYQSSDNDWGW